MEPPGPLKAVPGKRQELRSLLLLGITILVLLFLLILLSDELEAKPGQSRVRVSPDGNTQRTESRGLDASRASAKGEMLDPWGTPFQFTVSANGNVRARSAGPDKAFGTADDISADKNLSLR